MYVYPRPTTCPGCGRCGSCGMPASPFPQMPQWPRPSWQWPATHTNVVNA